MPPRAPSLRRLFAVLPAAALAAACGDGDAGDPPPTPAGDLRDAATAVSADTARAYARTAVGFENEVFYWDTRVNWARQSDSVLALAGAARTRGDMWSAVEASIDPWLRAAGDEHSAFFRPEDSPGVADSPSGDARFLVSGAPITTGGAAVAYLWLPTFSGVNDVGRADSTQQVIRALDQAAPCGWVLDLRFNPGGTWAAMMAGINPIFGNAPASRTATGFAGLVDNTDARAYLYVRDGEAGVYDPSDGRSYPQVRASANYALRSPNSPVAVLTGPLTASAGELITLGFRGGSVPFRSFGEATYGVTTTPVGIYFGSDSGYLNVTAGIMFDRTGTVYGSKITPDQLVDGARCLPRAEGGCPIAQQLFGAAYTRTTPTPSLADDAVLRAGVSWLRAQAACGGTTTARGPALSRAAAAAALPGAAKPNDTARRISRHFAPRTLGALVGAPVGGAR